MGWKGLTGKILITFRPLPTQNALTPPPSAYILPIAPQRFPTAFEVTEIGLRELDMAADGLTWGVSVVMR